MKMSTYTYYKYSQYLLIYMLHSNKEAHEQDEFFFIYGDFFKAMKLLDFKMLSKVEP